MINEIQDEILRLQSLGLLENLLEDKTTKGNILWGTDAYTDLGPDYGRYNEIMVDLITGENSGVIKNRAMKELGQQSQRTRQHAEVFTPVWVCNKMNNYADEEWFGYPDAFNTDGVPTEKVVFPQDKSWKDYIDSRRLEITCGEAPYLVSRYDVSTGEGIEIKNRIGILDRKLRIVNENTETEKDWLEWAFRAFKATYGYEFQGDNVLISRLNLLMTFEEYLSERWLRTPTGEEYQRLANVIAWNIWQMDGLTGTVPYFKKEDQYMQFSLFDTSDTGENEDTPEQPPCHIYDWVSNCSLEFEQLKERRFQV